MTESMSAFLATWLSRNASVELPDSTRQAVVKQLKDSVGVTLAGMRAPITQMVRTVNGPVSAFQQDGEWPDWAVAAVLGTAMRADDFDCSHVPGLTHAASFVYPTALAMGARNARASDEACIRAIALGQEIIIRLGLAARATGGAHSRGSPGGTIGAAAAAGLLLGLDATEMAHALGNACSFAPAGIAGEANRSGGNMKPMEAGWTAHAGMRAAQLARVGVTAPDTAIEGPRGFAGAFMGGSPDFSAVTEGLGSTWHVEDVTLKLYPTQGYTHAIIDAAIELRAKGVTAANLKHIRLGVPEQTVRVVAEPRDKKLHPKDGYEARYSGPITFAMGLMGSRDIVGLDELEDDAVDNSVLRELGARVEIESEPEGTKNFPVKLSCRAHAMLQNGDVIDIVIPNALRSPGPGLTDGELTAKVRACAEMTLKPDQVNQMEADLSALSDGSSQVLPRLLDLMMSACPAPGSLQP